MEKTKEQLLAELQALGIHPSGRKIRADVGSKRTEMKSRSDKGKKRNSFNSDTAAFAKKKFQDILVRNTDGGEGDNLTRDANLLFPPKLTSYYVNRKAGNMIKKMSRRRANHPESLRWRWYMAEYQLNPTIWGPKIAKWYFVKKDDIDFWTYDEWAWAYVNQIDGHENRLTREPITLCYSKFMKGDYTFPEYDDKGDLKW